MRKSGIKEISEIRNDLAQVLREETVPAESAEATRQALQALCEEASKHGLTTADVIRSVLSPLLEPKQGCACPTCKHRRGELEPVTSEKANDL